MNVTIGLTATNALSELFIITSWKGKEKAVFTFKEGELVDKVIKKTSVERHGTMVSFVPSEKYLGKCKVPEKDLFENINLLSYVVDPSISMKLHVLRTGKEAETVYKLTHKKGIVDCLDTFCKKQLVDPILIDLSLHRSEKESVRIQLAFTYDPEESEDKNMSFCNYVNTIDGGTHVDAAKYAISRCISRFAKDLMSESELKKFQVTNDDCRNGLHFVINTECKKPGFTGQSKEKAIHQEYFQFYNQGIYNELFKYFKENPKEIKKIVDYVKKIAKMRLEINKIKKSDSNPIDSLSENLLGNFSPATNINGYRELYIVEGGSAKGSFENARDPRYQAVFAVRGVSLNSFGAKLSDVMNNEEFKVLVKILGCGIGPHFNIKGLKYDKIIILSDADIDGYKITSLLSVFFFCHLPEVVKAGKLYKSVPPLYELKGKRGKEYTISKNDYIELCLQAKSEHLTFIDENRNKLSKRDVYNVLDTNRQYMDILRDIYRFNYVHPDIIEFVIRYRKDKNFNKMFSKRFNEMNVKDNTISGVYKGSYQFLLMDEKFNNKVIELDQLINITNKGNVYYYIEDDGYKSPLMSLGQILQYSEKYDSDILDRYKGLGQMSPEVFYTTTLDPNRRTLIQLTVENINTELANFRIIHGGGTEGPKARRKLLENYTITRDDLDS